MRVRNVCYALVVVLSLTSVTLSLSDEITVFVSPQGNDAHSGHEDQPVATLARAMDLVRDTRRKTGGDVDILVILGEGIYRITERVVISAEHASGPENWSSEENKERKSSLAGDGLFRAGKRSAIVWRLSSLR